MIALLVMTVGGCSDPVVFRPISNPKVQKADTPPKDIIVRTFAGYTLSQSEDYQGNKAEAMAVLTSGREPNRGRCRFVFFIGDMIVTIDLPVQGPLDAGHAELKGKAWDPRGWNVHWTATLRGGVIEGTFNQPHDHGTFRLREVK